MREDTIKSFAKINLSLGVLGKYNKNFHRIETLVSFIDLNAKLSSNAIFTSQVQQILLITFMKHDLDIVSMIQCTLAKVLSKIILTVYQSVFRETLDE